MYQCSECGRAVGFMGDIKGAPERYKCPHTGRAAKLQAPNERSATITPVPPDTLPPMRIRHADESKDLRQNRA